MLNLRALARSVTMTEIIEQSRVGALFFGLGGASPSVNVHQPDEFPAIVGSLRIQKIKILGEHNNDAGTEAIHHQST